MKRECTACKHSAWCLPKRWPVETGAGTVCDFPLKTQVVRCSHCGEFWRMELRPDVVGTFSLRIVAWQVRPCAEDEKWGRVDTCEACLGAPKYIHLPLGEEGVLDVRVLV